LDPSAQETTEYQFAVGTAFVPQVAPPSEELKMLAAVAAAASFIPSAEHVTEVQSLLETVVESQVPPALVET
jgi:hypothetical protein